MKKLAILTILLGFTGCAAFANYGYISAPTGGNRNFQPLMRHQFEQTETLDFVNDAEHYKEKREQQEEAIKHQSKMQDLKPTQFNLNHSRPTQEAPKTPAMEFSTTDDGHIIIKPIQ